jgi:hypothetical protein
MGVCALDSAATPFHVRPQPQPHPPAVAAAPPRGPCRISFRIMHVRAMHLPHCRPYLHVVLLLPHFLFFYLTILFYNYIIFCRPC